MKSTSILAGLILLLPTVSIVSAGDTAVSVVTGAPTGFGLEVTQRLGPQWNARIGAGIPFEAEPEDVKIGHNKFDVKVKFGGASALLDWHPTKGNFRLSGGLFLLPEKLTFERTKAPYELGTRTYNGAQLTQVRGEAKIGHRVAPAVLIGWGNPVKLGKRWGFNAEAGVAYSGDTEVSLSAQGPLANDPTLKAALESERQHIKDKSTMSVQLVARLGVSYRF